MEAEQLIESICEGTADRVEDVLSKYAPAATEYFVNRGRRQVDSWTR